MDRKQPVAVVLMLAASVGIVPYMANAGLIQWLDWHLHLYWLQEFHHSLLEGNLYPRWLGNTNGGYGAPVFAFYAPLSYFVGALGIAMTGSVLGGLKFVFCVGIFFSVFAAYGLLRKGNRPMEAAIFAALLGLSPQWLLFSYRMNMPATVLALAFVPLVFLGLRQLTVAVPRRGWLVAISFALVIVSHTLTGFMVGIVAGLWCLWFGLVDRDWRRMWSGLANLSIGVGLAAIYLLPALMELPLVHAEYLQASPWLWFKNFLFIAERSADAAFNVDAPFFDDINVALAVALVYSHAVFWKYGTRGHAAGLYFASAWFCFFMMLPLSAPIYDLLAPLQNIQLPWRWQPLFALFAMAAMATTWSCPQSRKLGLRVLQALPLAAGIYFSAVLTTVVGSIDVDVYHWTRGQDVAWALQASRWDTLEHRPRSMGDAWARDLSKNTDRPALFLQGSGTARQVLKRQQQQEWELDVSRAGKIRFKTLYFAGWTAYLDGQRTDTSYSTDLGAIVVTVPAGKHHLSLIFENTAWRWRGLAVSLAALLLLVYGIFRPAAGKRKGPVILVR